MVYANQVSTAGSDDPPREVGPPDPLDALEERGACAAIPWAGAAVEALKGGLIKKTVSNGVRDSSWDSYRLNQASVRDGPGPSPSPRLNPRAC